MREKWGRDRHHLPPLGCPTADATDGNAPNTQFVPKSVDNRRGEGAERPSPLSVSVQSVLSWMRRSDSAPLAMTRETNERGVHLHKVELSQTRAGVDSLAQMVYIGIEHQF